jgi:hypothetical protein
MREYDDHIRQRTPMIRRIIILVVVLTAVPVMLWTVTAFLRTYVAQPKTPTFRPLAATALMEAPDSANAATGPEQSSRPIVEARATATDARSTPTFSIRKPPADRSPDTDAGVAANGSQVAAAAPAQPSTVTMSASALAVPQPTAPAMYATPPAPTGGAIWPDPPKFGSGSAAPAAQPSASTDADALPPAQPITGRIPLPPRRPHLFAMVQSGVPVPRARPPVAPEPAPVAPPDPPFDRLLIH